MWADWCGLAFSSSVKCLISVVRVADAGSGLLHFNRDFFVLGHRYDSG